MATWKFFRNSFFTKHYFKFWVTMGRFSLMRFIALCKCNEKAKP